MKAVIYGNGYWSNILARYIVSSNIEIIGIVDINTSKSKEKKMIDNADVGFVCTPVETHYNITKKLLSSGVHVFCEKILTDNFETTQELINLAKKKELVLFTDYTYLYSPSVNFIKQNIHLVGEVKFIKGTIKQYGKFYSDCNVLENIGVHLISAFHYIFDFDMSQNYIYRLSNSFYDYDYQYIGQANNVNIFLTCSLLSNIKTREVEIIGSSGILSYNMLSDDTVIYTNYEDKNKNFTKYFDEKNNLDYTLKEFILYINNKLIYGENQEIALLVSNDIDKISRENNILTSRR